VRLSQVISDRSRVVERMSRLPEPGHVSCHCVGVHTPAIGLVGIQMVIMVYSYQHGLE